MLVDMECGMISNMFVMLSRMHHMHSVMFICVIHVISIMNIYDEYYN